RDAARRTDAGRAGVWSGSGALSWFVAAYATLAQWKATVDRLTGFQAAIVAAKTRAAAPGITRVSHPADSVDLREVTVSLPDGQRLVCNIDVSLRPGERWLITGSTGTGKSTSCERSQESGVSDTALSNCRSARACCSCRGARIFRSVRCATRFAIRRRARRSTTA